MFRHILFILTLATLSNCARVLLIGESSEQQLVQLFTEAKSASFQVTTIYVDHGLDEPEQNSSFCASIAGSPFAAIVDLSWGGWDAAFQIAAEIGAPYLRVEASNAPFVEAADNFMLERDAADVALVFENEAELDQSLYFIIGNYEARVIVISLDDTNRNPYERLGKLRPIPTASVAFGTAQMLSAFVNQAVKHKLFERDSRWHLFIEDFSSNINLVALNVDVIVVSLREGVNCCGLKRKTVPVNAGCNCTSGTKPKQIIAKTAGQVIANAVQGLPDVNYQCSLKTTVNQRQTVFMEKVKAELGSSNYKIDASTSKLFYPLQLDFKLVKKQKKQHVNEVGTWNPVTKMVVTEEYRANKSLPRIMRVGMTPSAPWLFFRKNANGEKLRDARGNLMFDGYCYELLNEIASKAGFEYEIVLSSDWQRPGFEYGKKLKNGSWSGMIGDLASGDVDIIVADLTMTSEREEIIDFVSPYFEQAGISIVLRKKIRDQSLFKFLQVLQPEVWLGISAAVFITAILVWFLDKYSPYSAQNNRAAYPEPSRIFTLKESFWYALTSLTPQGGGEGPKALSGKVLTSAYWLFVVLMLATFTANLAAFLTIERMQSNLQGLEELARQSRINYTVVKNTAYFEYFENMASAEEELYQKWKELSLNGSDNPGKYRVWDYPIREQYTHILQVIKETGPVESSAAGFEAVRNHTKADFAFIHDAAKIRYEVYNDCDLVEIGEPFAEQPYALAVQHGSHLQEMLSRAILELQKDRYFEALQAKYWNSEKRANCPVLDDSEGITLQSLGGVFIATLIGLAIAMVTLVVEVYFQKKRAQKAVVDESHRPKGMIKTISVFDVKIGGKTACFKQETLDPMPKVS